MVKVGHQQLKQPKLTNSWRLDNSILDEKWVNAEIKKENRDLLELNENEYTT